jgi:hypothetical protein
MFNVFRIIDFVRNVKITKTEEDINGNIISSKEQTGPTYLNTFGKIGKKNLEKHFKSLISLVDEYNLSVKKDFDKLTIRNINNLTSTSDPNINEYNW